MEVREAKWWNIFKKKLQTSNKKVNVVILFQKKKIFDHFGKINQLLIGEFWEVTWMGINLVRGRLACWDISIVKKTVFIGGSGDDETCSGKEHGTFGSEQISLLMGTEKIDRIKWQTRYRVEGANAASQERVDY